MNIVFTITVDFQSPRIVIEKWELVDDQEYRTKQVTVYQGANNRIYVTGAPLIIEFPKLFLQHTKIPREEDIGFPNNVLENIAITI